MKEWLDYFSRHDDFLGHLVVGLAATIEYLFPPFPGDTVTVACAFLITHRGWSWVLVFVALTLGSAVGIGFNYWIGRVLATRQTHWAVRLRSEVSPVLEAFDRHGVAYLIINRFVPAMRGLVFYAAGMAALPFSKVMLTGLLSAVAWNACLLGLGIALGHQWDRVEAVLRNYSRGVWALVAIALLVWGTRWLMRRRKQVA